MKTSGDEIFRISRRNPDRTQLRPDPAARLQKKTAVFAPAVFANRSSIVNRSGNSAAAQQLARGRVGALTLLECDLAVDHDRAVALGALNPTPLTTREVMHDLKRLDRQLVQIVNDH